MRYIRTVYDSSIHRADYIDFLGITDTPEGYTQLQLAGVRVGSPYRPYLPCIMTADPFTAVRRAVRDMVEPLAGLGESIKEECIFVWNT